nr:ARID DNA-binding domain-containing protein [Tanacetum cinerariifolium]
MENSIKTILEHQARAKLLSTSKSLLIRGIELGSCGHHGEVDCIEYIKEGIYFMVKREDLRRNEICFIIKGYLLVALFQRIAYPHNKKYGIEQIFSVFPTLISTYSPKDAHALKAQETINELKKTASNLITKVTVSDNPYVDARIHYNLSERLLANGLHKEKRTVMRTEEELKYPERVHVITDYMIEGTDYSNWDNIWLKSRFRMKQTQHEKKNSYGIREAVVETNKNEIVIHCVLYTPEVTLNVLSLDQLLAQGFVITYGKSGFRMKQTQHEKKNSYGIREAVVETNKNEIVIPCVLYTPEVTLNVLSLDQLLAQGFVITYGHDKCRISYMFGEEKEIYDGESDYGKGKGCDVKTENACPLIKVLEELKWDRNTVQDYLDDDYISVNGTLYAIKVNSFQRLISFLDLMKNEKLVYENWNILSKRFEDMLKWFYLVYLRRDVLEPLPPIIGGVKIDLLGDNETDGDQVTGQNDGGNTSENDDFMALYDAKEACLLRAKLLSKHFIIEWDENDKIQKFAYKILDKLPSCNLSVGSQDFATNDYVPTLWNTVRCYLESALQTGILLELIGYRDRARLILVRGSRIANFLKLTLFFVSFSTTI